ncbi:MAG TPA: hypothetical protein VFC38_06995 [Stellaceae bacterium]|nr:hypothetical protein [Stellaceae bacterium]
MDDTDLTIRIAAASFDPQSNIAKVRQPVAQAFVQILAALAPGGVLDTR